MVGLNGVRQPENGLAMVLATLNFVSGCFYAVFQHLCNRSRLRSIRLLIFDDHRAGVNMVKAHPATDSVQRVLELRFAGKLGIGRIAGKKGGLQGLHGLLAAAVALYPRRDF